MTATGDITDRLRQEFRVRDWWPGMDSFDSARGETVPHPVAEDAASEIEHLRAFILLMDDIAYLDHDDIVRLHSKYAAVPGMADAVHRAFDSASHER